MFSYIVKFCWQTVCVYISYNKTDSIPGLLLCTKDREGLGKVNLGFPNRYLE